MDAMGNNMFNIQISRHTFQGLSLYLECNLECSSERSREEHFRGTLNSQLPRCSTPQPFKFVYTNGPVFKLNQLLITLLIINY